MRHHTLQGPCRYENLLTVVCVRLAVVGLALLAPFGHGSRAATAGSHSLLVWVGDYGDVRANLPGAAHDAVRAAQIARRFGGEAGRVVTLSERSVTQNGLDSALLELEGRIQPGDRVLLYFSVHGRQIDGGRFGVKCSEGLVMQDGSLYLDIALQNRLARLVSRAGLVVVMNDSCHAGGAATKHLGGDPPADADERPKTYPLALSRSAVSEHGGDCGVAVNKSPGLGSTLARGIDSGRWVYLAAARADELAYSSSRGSRATTAWDSCIADSRLGADTDRDGWISGDELQRCAQSQVNRMGGRPQTLTVEGHGSIRVVRAP